MAIHTGQRQADLLSPTWKRHDGTPLMFEQGKSKPGKPKRRVRVKVYSRLKALIDSLPKDTIRIMNNSRAAVAKDGFRTSCGKECDRLHIEGVTFHDLRGTFITDRRREGETAEQIATITEHSIAAVGRVLETHYLATDQQTSDAVIVRMKEPPENSKSKRHKKSRERSQTTAGNDP